MNLYSAFRELLREPRLQIGTVSSISGGVAVITLQSGGVVHARGSASAGDTVFVRDGVIEGPAPTMTSYDIEV